jgi:hypothetical protein
MQSEFMSLLELYKKNNENPDWFDDYSSLAKGRFGRMFEYVNTNFRTQKSFEEHFLKFEDVVNLPRDKWPTASHGQEKHKHAVVNMIQSKLYKKDSKGLYSKTATDRERRHLINALLSNRAERLKTVGLEIDLEKIYEYYKISD